MKHRMAITCPDCKIEYDTMFSTETRLGEEIFCNKCRAWITLVQTESRPEQFFVIMEHVTN